MVWPAFKWSGGDGPQRFLAHLKRNAIRWVGGWAGGGVSVWEEGEGGWVGGGVCVWEEGEGGWVGGGVCVWEEVEGLCAGLADAVV